ncbi:hypothetical protein ACTXT7_012219 [Hymenolepis weldensis]
MRAKGLLNKLKHPEEQEDPWFFSDEKTSTKMKKSIEEMIGGYVQADSNEVPTGLRVNADSYVETLQTG